MRSQSAFEFMTIVAIGLILIAIASTFGVDYITSYFRDINIINARQTVESINSGINLIYAQGTGAVTKVYVTIPDNLIREGTYLYKNKINLRFDSGGVKDVYKNLKINVFGSLPLIGGKTTFLLKMTEIGAFVYLPEHEISFIYVGTYADSSYTEFKDEFTSGETVYYLIILRDINDSDVSSNINLIIYSPNGTKFEENLFVDGSLKGSFFLEDNYENGYWLISAMTPDKTIGTAIFKKI